jgi:hypothetical protein
VFLPTWPGPAGLIERAMGETSQHWSMPEPKSLAINCIWPNCSFIGPSSQVFGLLGC